MRIEIDRLLVTGLGSVQFQLVLVIEPLVDESQNGFEVLRSLEAGQGLGIVRRYRDGQFVETQCLGPVAGLEGGLRALRNSGSTRSNKGSRMDSASR